MRTLANKRIIITGASSGIGQELAFQLAECGGSLVLASRNEAKLNKVNNQIHEIFPMSPKSHVVPTDITSENEIRKLITFCNERLNGIDILINCAGVGLYGKTLNASMNEIRQVMEVNYFGAVQCIQEVLPIMINQKQGIIVNIVSVAAFYGIPYLSTYSASKGALALYSQGLRAEIRKSGVKIINIHPGYTDTDFFDHEIKTGGARYPKSTYDSPVEVAKTTVRAIKKETPEVIITSYGKILFLARSIAPYWLRKSMNVISKRLKL